MYRAKRSVEFCLKYTPQSFSRRFARVVNSPKLRRDGTFVHVQQDPFELFVLKYPHPKLREENKEVTVFDNTLAETIARLFRTMYREFGLGLAAPQVGINQRILVFNEALGEGKEDYEIALINPKIVYSSPDKAIDEESCLSFPGVLGNVERSTHIAVRYQDVKGRYQYIEFFGILARGVAHELDHLDKVLFIDRFTEADLSKNSKRLEANIRQFGDGARP